MKKFVLAVMAVVLTACTTVQTYPNYRALAAKVVPSNVELVASVKNQFTDEFQDKTYCSGVAITPTHILTAGHCVTAARKASPERAVALFDGKIKIRLIDGREVLAKIISATDEQDEFSFQDAAFLVLDEALLTPAVLGDSDTVAVGDRIAVVGNTFGELSFSFTVGVVSHIKREIPGGYAIQSDVTAGPGNSGGGVFDMNGRLVGILTGGMGGAGVVSFILPINGVLQLVKTQ